MFKGFIEEGFKQKRFIHYNFTSGGVFLKISFIVPIISYGKYSKTFINYILYTSKNQDSINYLTILNSKWIIKSEKLFVMAKKLLKQTQN